MKKVLLFVVVYFFSICCLQGQDLLQDIKNRGFINIGINGEADPFGYLYDGVFQGVDVDIANEIAKSLNVKLVIKPIEGASYRERYLIKDLFQKRLIDGVQLDLIVAIYSPSTQRDEYVSFSIPYFSIEKGLGLITHRNQDMANLNDFIRQCQIRQKKNGNSCIGYVENSNAAKYYEKYLKGKYGLKSKDEDNQKDVWDEFNQGKIAGILDDFTLLQKVVEHNKSFQLIPLDINLRDEYAVGMPKGEKRLKSHIDSLVTELNKPYLGSDTFARHKLKEHMQINSIKEVYKFKSIIIYIIIIGFIGSVVVIWFFPIKPPPPIQMLANGDPSISKINIGRSFAWLIGNNEYESPNFNNLEYCIKHIEDFGHILNEKYNFKEENIQLTKNATREKIINGFHELNSSQIPDKNRIIKFQNRISEKDSLIIYFSGHGDYTQGIGSWVPSDSLNITTHVRNSTIQEELKLLSQKIKHILIIADCCFSGTLLSQTKGTEFENFDQSISPNLIEHIRKSYEKNSVHVITSGELEEVLDNSEFPKILNNLLDEEEGPVVTCSKLYQKIQDNIIEHTAPLPQPQFGVLRDTKHEGGQFLFINKTKIPKEFFTEYVGHEWEVLRILRDYKKGFFKESELREILKINESKLQDLIKSIQNQGYIIDVSKKIGALAKNEIVWMIVKEKIKENLK
ncbi:transporter substrate-binding domain-containing protein [Fulvivirgaceae bacterium BMA12]|uniref:Transporter substrate-binding domain-containing protein n=1 Tax=Agaribacillus aureus TaxID=3051825 RepID=A0ABT8LBI4_9BACT|nr:transporter substrate-binding domain-containing protein [Fulvivirgaceae bacterium BMA12]